MKKKIMILCLISQLGVYSQSVYLKTGMNITDFQFKSSEGKKSDLINAGLGSAYEIGYTFPLRKLSRFSADVALILNEYNAISGIPGLNNKWNTVYIGIQNSLTFSVVKLDYASIDIKTGFNVSASLYAKQDLNGVLYDVRNFSEFDGAIFQPLFGVQANLKASKNCNLSIGYNFVKSISDSKNLEKLSIETNQIMLGVHVNILKTEKK